MSRAVVAVDAVDRPRLERAAVLGESAMESSAAWLTVRAAVSLTPPTVALTVQTPANLDVYVLPVQEPPAPASMA